MAVIPGDPVQSVRPDIIATPYRSGQVNPGALGGQIVDATRGLGQAKGQALGAGQFLWDVMRGDEDPHGVRDWLHGIMYGPAPKK